MTREILRSHGLLTADSQSEVEPPAAERAELERFHDGRYLDLLVAAEGGDLGVEGLEMGLGTSDCPIFHGLVRGAALACGASLTGARLLLEDKTDIVFNPSGGFHHAGPARASGFCYLNDVALACLALADANRRVFYLDVDVHHGDGVQNAFYDRPDVMTVSLHQDGRTLFPGTGMVDEIGTGAGRGYSVNVPLPAGTYDEVYLQAFNTIVPPLAAAFAPDVIVLELGMDALAGDPLAGLSLTNNTYASVVEAVMGFGRPILATGGGGYHVQNTARGWALAWCVFSGQCGSHDDLAGLGGVLLESTDWAAGLRDRAVIPARSQREEVQAAVKATIRAVKTTVFGIHGL